MLCLTSLVWVKTLSSVLVIVTSSFLTPTPKILNFTFIPPPVQKPPLLDSFYPRRSGQSCFLRFAEQETLPNSRGLITQSSAKAWQEQFNRVDVSWCVYSARECECNITETVSVADQLLQLAQNSRANFIQRKWITNMYGVEYRSSKCSPSRLLSTELVSGSSFS